MLRKMLISIVACMASTCAMGQTTCSDYNKPATPLPIDLGGPATGAQNHINGYHLFTGSLVGSCTYTSVGLPNCATTAEASGSISGNDTGVTTLGYQHKFGDAVYPNPAQNQAPNGGATVQAGTTGAATVTACVLSCAATIGFSGGQYGVGVSISFPPQAIFGQPTTNLVVTCANEPDPQYSGGGGGGGGGGGPGGNGDGDCGGGDLSPIVIDTKGVGFQFTNPADACIRFNLKDNGKPVCLSWPVVGSGNAWLALPDAKGTVHNSKQLFGNFTPQPHHQGEARNGFLALAQYDDNGDHVIDAKDQVWTKLRLWIDEHCYKNPQAACTSERSELHTLDSAGVESISLIYGEDNKTDQWGNLFKLYSHIGDRMDQTVYDVFLVKGGPHGDAECK